jgi:integrase/recombinase XerC
LTLPKWRDGRFDVRPGVGSKTVLDDWKLIVQEAYAAGYFEVVDALQDGTLSFPEALRIKRTGKGVAAIAEKVEELEAQAAETALPTLPDLFDEFLRSLPRQASEKQHHDIVSDCRAFLRGLLAQENARRKEAGEDELRDVRKVSLAFWTKPNLRVYVADYVRTKHDRWLELKEEKLSALKPTERQRLVERDRGAKQNSANRHVNSVGAMSQWLIERGFLDHDPAVTVRIPASKELKNREGDVRGLERDVAQGLIKWARAYDMEHPCKPRSRPDALWAEWLLRSGATTYTEGVRVRPVDIKSHQVDESGTVPVHLIGSKGSARPRDVYVPQEFATRLLERARAAKLGPESQLFPFEELQGRGWWTRLMLFIQARDPDLYVHLKDSTPYALRHTFARNLLAAGMNIYDVMVLMGHRSIETTAIYLGQRSVDRTKARAAADRFRFD